MFRKLAKILFLACVLPLLIPLVLVVAPPLIAWVICKNVYRSASMRWHAWRTGTWIYVVCSRRRGWHEFGSNNLQAALPAGVSMIWANGNGHTAHSSALRSLAACSYGVIKPCLVEVRPFRVRTRSLHERLLPLKTFTRKNNDVQQTLRELIEAELPPRRANV
jgi:hypothetical protein